MRNLVLLTLFLANLVQAYPVTLTFTGKVTSIDLRASGNSNTPLDIDPNEPFTFNGVQIFNGNSLVSGTFTFDTDSNHYNYNCSKVLDVSYQMSLEGATYSREPARSCQDDFDADINRISAHFEGPALKHNGGLDSSIQNFLFNFANGTFVDGSFSLDYMMGNGLFGPGIRGIIDSVTLASVPEPGAWMLVIAGLVGVALLRGSKPSRQR